MACYGGMKELSLSNQMELLLTSNLTVQDIRSTDHNPTAKVLYTVRSIGTIHVLYTYSAQQGSHRVMGSPKP
jgi:hypothetical protein